MTGPRNRLQRASVKEPDDGDGSSELFRAGFGSFFAAGGGRERGSGVAGGGGVNARLKCRSRRKVFSCPLLPGPLTIGSLPFPSAENLFLPFRSARKVSAAVRLTA